MLQVEHLARIYALRKKCPNTDFFGPYFSAFGLNTDRYEVSVLSPNAGKYGPEKTSYLDTFQAMTATNLASTLLSSFEQI